MKACPQCNTEIGGADVRFCPECGAQVEIGRGKRKSVLMLTGGLLCLLLVVSFVFRDQIARALPFLRPGGIVLAARLAPADTDVFGVMNPNLGQIKEFNRIKDIYLSIPEVKRAFDQVDERLVNELGLVFDDDIKPWLGREVAVIIPEIDPVIQEYDPPFLFAIETTSQKKADACMDKVRQKAKDEGSSFTVKDYKGVEVTIEEGTSSPLVYAVTKDFLLLSNNEQLVNRTIDLSKSKGKESLSGNEAYQEVMAKLPKDRTACVYVDLRAATGSLKSAEPEFQSLNYLDAYKAFATSLSFVEEGVRVDYALAYDPERLPPGFIPERSNSSKYLERTTQMVPGNTVAFFGSANYLTALESLLKETENQPGFEDFSTGLDFFENETGIDLYQDVFSFTRGDAAIALLPDSEALWNQEFPLGFLTLVGVNSTDVAKQKMQKIADVLSRQGLTVRAEISDGLEIYCLYDPFSGDMLGGYSLVGDYLVIGSSRGAIGSVAKQHQPLAGDSSFKEATSNPPGRRSSYTYLNIEKGVSILINAMTDYDREAFRRDVYPYLEPITAVGLVNQETDPKTGLAQGCVTISIR